MGVGNLHGFIGKKAFFWCGEVSAKKTTPLTIDRDAVNGVVLYCQKNRSLLFSGFKSLFDLLEESIQFQLFGFIQIFGLCLYFFD